MNDPVLVLGGVVIAVVFVAAAMRSNRRSRADAAAWEQAVRLLGGDFELTRPGKLRGHIGEYPVWTDPWGAKKATSAKVTPYVEYKVWLDLPDRSLQIAPHGRLLDESLPALIGHGVDTGDPAFSSAFQVRADDVGAALAFLTPDRRAALLRLHREFPKAFLEFERLTLRVRGAREEADRMVATVRRLGELAADIAPPGIK